MARQKPGAISQTDHHRKPESIGGTNGKTNKSRVSNYKHEAWHILFNNCPATKVFENFVLFYEVFNREDKSELQQTINKEWIDSKPRWVKWRRAWQTLFGGMTLSQIVEEINGVWLDPDYQFCLASKTKQEVILNFQP